MEKKNEITFCVKSKYALYSDPLNRVSGEKFSRSEERRVGKECRL